VKLAVRLFVILIGILVAWIGMVQPASASPARPLPATVYGYNSQVHTTSALMDSDWGRGPPAHHRQRGTTHAPNGPTTCVAYAYGGLARCVRIASRGRGAEVQAGTAEPGSVVVLPLDVAAKSGDDLIRLSTKDSWANLKTLDDHFARHGADFSARSADEYASMATEFFQRGGAQQLPTKIAPDGTIRMFDPTTNTFGSFAPNGMTKTFFKPTSPTYWDRQPGVLQ
jgi:hypothetical protein